MKMASPLPKSAGPLRRHLQRLCACRGCVEIAGLATGYDCMDSERLMISAGQLSCAGPASLAKPGRPVLLAVNQRVPDPLRERAVQS